MPSSLLRTSLKLGLAAFLTAGGGQDLGEYLGTEVFAGADLDVVEPDAVDVAGFSAYLERFEAGLAIERAATAAL